MYSSSLLEEEVLLEEGGKDREKPGHYTSNKKKKDEEKEKKQEEGGDEWSSDWSVLKTCVAVNVDKRKKGLTVETDWDVCHDGVDAEARL